MRDAELAEILSPFLEDAPADLGGVLEDLQDRVWLARDNSGALHLTPEGASARRRASASVVTIRKRLSEGITAEDYERTVAALKRMVINLESRRNA